MSSISRQRCLNHLDREAVVRCPRCRNYFCRECVTEHDERMICAACLGALSEGHAVKKGRGRGIRLALQCVVSFFLLWFVFYAAGRLLLAIPSDFHEATLWEQPWWEEE